MGSDKLRLPWHGRPLALHVLDVVASLGGPVTLAVVDRAQLAGLDLPAGVSVVTDESPDLGPIGGLAAGLRTCTADIAFTCGVDLPLLDPTTCRLLVDLLASAPASTVAVIPVVDGELQVLHAAWRRTALPEIDAAIAAGRRALRSLPDALRDVHGPDAVLAPGEEDLRRLGATLASFTNVNTPADLAALTG